MIVDGNTVLLGALKILKLRCCKYLAIGCYECCYEIDSFFDDFF